MIMCLYFVNAALKNRSCVCALHLSFKELLRSNSVNFGTNYYLHMYMFFLQAEVRRSALLGLDVRGMLNLEAADSQVSSFLQSRYAVFLSQRVVFLCFLISF